MNNWREQRRIGHRGGYSSVANYLRTAFTIDDDIWQTILEIPSTEYTFKDDICLPIIIRIK